MTSKLSLFENSTNLLTKTIHDKGQHLEKDASTARMYLGKCLVTQTSPLELYRKLMSLNSTHSPKNIALGLGVPLNNPAIIVSKAIEKKYPDGIARTKDHFSFEDGPGYLLLDYDPEPAQASLSAKEYRERLIEALPELAPCAMVVSHSTSSGIYHRHPLETDYETVTMPNPLYGLQGIEEGSENEFCEGRQQKPMTGNGGLHVYIPVSDAREIPRILNIIHQRLWLKSFGYIKVSQAGSFLVRSLVDTAVGSPERLVFESRPALDSSLFQLRRDPEYYEGDTLDAAAVVDLSASELAIYESLIAEAKEKAKPEAEALGRIFREKKVADMIAQGVDRRTAETTVKSATGEQPELKGCWTLTFNEHGQARVVDVLLDPQRYHQAELIDPTDDQESGRWRARLYANSNGTVLIHSFDDGGIVYRLTRRELYLNKGVTQQIMSSMESILMETSEPSLYQRSGELVFLIKNDQGGVITHLANKHTLGCLISKLASALRSVNGQWVAADVDQKYLESFLNLKRWSLPKLVGVVTHPTLGPKGELVQRERYDYTTGLYLDFSGFNFYPIPEHPTKTDAEQALNFLRQIYRTFDFKTEVDFAAHLAALLTGIIRRSLPTAPLFHYGAPVPGTGKTLLASSISIVLTGHEPRTMSYTSNEDESRKRYMAFLCEGYSVGLIDNVNATLAGDALCLILTAPIYTDRYLGISKMVSAPTNTLLLSTGNNTIIGGDLTRRVLQIQLDPMCERPHERHYDDDFKAVCRAKRADILGAGLTILRAYECAGRPDVGLAALGSFEDWSRRVRNAIVWLGVTDPVESLAINSNEDETLQQLGELLESWLWCYGSQAVTAKEVVFDCDKSLRDSSKSQLAAAISEVAIINGNRMDGRVLGNYVAKHKGRIVNQLRFESCGEKQRAKKWRVVRVD